MDFQKEFPDFIEESKIETKVTKVEDQKLILKAYSDGQKFVRISVTAKDVEECPPVDLFCCVDVSGSMRGSCAG